MLCATMIVVAQMLKFLTDFNADLENLLWFIELHYDSFFFLFLSQRVKKQQR